jgi:sortase A
MKIIVKLAFITTLLIASSGLIKIGYYHVKTEVAQYLLESAWSTNVKKSKPWPWADTWPVFKIVLPSIQVSSLVLKDVSGESLAFGPGLMTPNKLPGELGNSFIAAHRDTHFKNIGKLKKGDEIIVQKQAGELLTFVVDSIQVINSKIEQANTATDDKRITLVTCYPFDAKEANTPFRYLVSAVLVLEVS